MTEKFRIVRVTITQDYMLPISSDGTTYNGQTVDDLVKEWFITHGMNRYHASRDASRVGNSTVLLGTKVLDKNEI